MIDEQEKQVKQEKEITFLLYVGSGHPTALPRLFWKLRIMNRSFQTDWK